MLIAVTLDAEGHFQVSDVDNREETWILLKSIEWGQFYEDKVADLGLEEYEMEPDIYDLDPPDWEEYLQNFVTGGQFEILEV
jgi:hypothetical protein